MQLAHDSPTPKPHNNSRFALAGVFSASSIGIEEETVLP
jgi:hypothetical protein